MLNSQARSEYINGLRNFAQLLEDHPDLVTPNAGYLRFDMYLSDKKDAQTLMRTIGGKFEKKASDYTMAFQKPLNETGSVILSLNLNREAVCERVVTGKKMVAALFIPEHEEEIVEWKCGSVLEPEPLEAALAEIVGTSSGEVA